MTTVSTDREGKFSLFLFPGDYGVTAHGQAGKIDAHWVEMVNANGLSKIILSAPICTYESDIR
jgi:hypothetical protein